MASPLLCRYLARAAALALAALLAAATGPARATTFRDVEIVCPLDGTVFRATMLNSGLQTGIGLDFKPLGMTPAPWPLAQCPGNGFVIYKSEFSAYELSRLRVIVRGETYQSMLGQDSPHFLAAHLMAAMHEPPSRIAVMLLRATWEARGREQYRTYALAALAAYEKLLHTHHGRPHQRLFSSLVAGELERRLGLFEQARHRFLAIPFQGRLGEPYDRIIQLQLELIERGRSGPESLPPPPARTVP